MIYTSSKVGQIAENSNRPRIETILHLIYKVSIDRGCFQIAQVLVGKWSKKKERKKKRKKERNNKTSLVCGFWSGNPRQSFFVRDSKNGGAMNFHFGGYIPGGIEYESPSELNQFTDIVYRF